MILDPEENGKKMDTPKYQFTEVGGLRVRYADRGFGDSVVLLLHGFGGCLLYTSDAADEEVSVGPLGWCIMTILDNHFSS